MARKVKKSESGLYKVELARTFPHLGFDYKPGAGLAVNEEILNLMLAEEGLVVNAQPAD